MPKISTEDCRLAIAQWCEAHPGHVARQFVEPVDEAGARNPKTWKREAKTRIAPGEIDAAGYSRFAPGATCVRQFACRAYGDGDELRAYVYDDGENILNVVVLGE